MLTLILRKYFFICASIKQRCRTCTKAFILQSKC